MAPAFVKNDLPMPLSKMIGPCLCQKWLAHALVKNGRDPYNLQRSLQLVLMSPGLIIFICDSRWTHYFHLWLTKVFKNVIWTHQIKLLQVHVSLIYWYMYVQVHGMSCKMVNVTLCRYILLGKFFTSNSNLTTYNNTIKIIVMVDNIATEIMSVKTISIFVFFFCSSYRVYLMTYFIYFKYWI